MKNLKWYLFQEHFLTLELNCYTIIMNGQTAKVRGWPGSGSIQSSVRHTKSHGSVGQQFPIQSNLTRKLPISIPCELWPCGHDEPVILTAPLINLFGTVPLTDISLNSHPHQVTCLMWKHRKVCESTGTITVHKKTGAATMTHHWAHYHRPIVLHCETMSSHC